MKKTVLFFILVISLIGMNSCNTSDIDEPIINEPQINREVTLTLIKIKMQTQEEAWNTGNLEGFMQSYWQSDSLMFLGKSGISYGWQTTLDNYVKGYASPEEMGKLNFTNEIVRFIDIKTIQVIGKWHLKREGELEDLEGHYSLIWKKKDGDWVIISDHSS